MHALARTLNATFRFRSRDRSSRSAKIGKTKYEKERKEVWPLCQVVFNTAFHTEELSMSFDKFRVDYSHKDRHHHEFVENFGMSLIFADKVATCSQSLPPPPPPQNRNPPPQRAPPPTNTK